MTHDFKTPRKLSWSHVAMLKKFIKTGPIASISLDLLGAVLCINHLRTRRQEALTLLFVRQILGDFIWLLLLKQNEDKDNKKDSKKESKGGAFVKPNYSNVDHDSWGLRSIKPMAMGVQ